MHRALRPGHGTFSMGHPGPERPFHFPVREVASFQERLTPES